MIENEQERTIVRENDRERTPTPELQQHVIEEAVSLRLEVCNLNCTDSLYKIGYFSFFLGLNRYWVPIWGT